VLPDNPWSPGTVRAMLNPSRRAAPLKPSPSQAVPRSAPQPDGTTGARTRQQDTPGRDHQTRARTPRLRPSRSRQVVAAGVLLGSLFGLAGPAHAQPDRVETSSAAANPFPTTSETVRGGPAEAAQAALERGSSLAAADQELRELEQQLWQWVLQQSLGTDTAPPDLLGATVRREIAQRLYEDQMVAVAATIIETVNRTGSVDPEAVDRLSHTLMTTDPRRRDAVLRAVSHTGKPYLWGGSGPDAFDCSGLTQQAWVGSGVDLPHWSFGQRQQLRSVTADEVQPGDLVFWDNGWNHRRGVRAGHVAMMLGVDNLLVEAVGTRVRVGHVHTTRTIVGYGQIAVDPQTNV
jgi:cell wall-associated NlpC family hydrolase